jgi:hypothetical protein
MDQDDVPMAIPASDMERWLPNYDDRRAILARDGLASVDGFRTGILLVCEFLWGLRVCPMCTECTHGNADHGCQDLCGSNAFAEGGILGRGDGVYISIEAQKSAGSLHSTQLVREEAWPAYSMLPELVSKPSYLTSDMEPEKWRETYLSEHLRRVQEMMQHHVHTLNQQGGRVPLLHCRRADNPTKCEGDFPRTMWLIDRAVVLRQGLINKNGHVARRQTKQIVFFSWSAKRRN